MSPWQPLFLVFASTLPTSPALPKEPLSKPLEFRLTFAANISKKPFTGRIFVVASKQPIKEGPQRQNWFKPEPFFAQDVLNWKPGEPLAFQPRHYYPQPFAQLEPGKYHFQAIMDLDRGGQNALTAPGNGYSRPVELDLGSDQDGPVCLVLDHVVPQAQVCGDRTRQARLHGQQALECFPRQAHPLAGGRRLAEDVCDRAGPALSGRLRNSRFWGRSSPGIQCGSASYPRSASK